jgi:hypothetical protein
MNLRHLFWLSLLLLLPCGVLNASTLVIRDSIGPDTSSTNGMPGGYADHDGSIWGTPGLVVNVPGGKQRCQERMALTLPQMAPQQRLSTAVAAVLL